MVYYKVKSVTNTLGKRDINKDNVLDIEYVIGLEKKTFKLNAGGILYMSCNNLPISLHKLRMKKLIQIIEISENEFLSKQKNDNKTQIVPIIPVKEDIKPTKEVKQQKKVKTTTALKSKQKNK